MRTIGLFALTIISIAPLCMGEVISGIGADKENWNLIANFREGGGIITNDSSSNTIAMTLTNGPTWVSGLPGRGNAINFDGLNDVVQVPLASDFTNRSTFTVVVLFKNPSGGDNRILVAKGIWPNTGWWFRTGATGAKLGVYMRGTPDNYQYLEAVGITNAMFINDRWHTAVFVYRGKLIGTQLKEFWFDGVSYPTTDSTTLGGEQSLSNNAALTIGDDAAGTFSNMIDEIGCVMVSRDGYAPDAVGMMSLHRRLMGQVSQGAR